tara:strand:- start:24 stop:227 length:204 start_codon:yes stop_codon:yes gene_type:complete
MKTGSFHPEAVKFLEAKHMAYKKRMKELGLSQWIPDDDVQESEGEEVPPKEPEPEPVKELPPKEDMK